MSIVGRHLLRGPFPPWGSVPHDAVPAFTAHFDLSASFLLMWTLRGSMSWPKYLAAFYPLGRPEWICRPLASKWVGLTCSGNLENESVDENFLFLPFKWTNKQTNLIGGWHWDAVGWFAAYNTSQYSFLAPSLGLAQHLLLRTIAERTSRWKISLCIFLSHVTLPFK